MAILHQLLPKKDFREHVESDKNLSFLECDKYVFSSFRERARTGSGIALDLATSVDGAIYGELPAEISSRFSKEHREALQENYIPFGSDVKHRAVHVRCERGDFFLIFHPFSASVEDRQNTHLLCWHKSGHWEYNVVVDNHFKSACQYAVEWHNPEVDSKDALVDIEIQEKIGRLASIVRSKLNQSGACASDTQTTGCL